MIRYEVNAPSAPWAHRRFRRAAATDYKRQAETLTDAAVRSLEHLTPPSSATDRPAARSAKPRGDEAPASIGASWPERGCSGAKRHCSEGTERQAVNGDSLGVCGAVLHIIGRCILDRVGGQLG